MNCVPGDIARIVNNTMGNNDRLVRVIAAIPSGFAPAGWWDCVALQRILVDVGGGVELQAPGTEVFCADANLRPIRDPGPDAVDQTLAWKPVPFPTIKPELLGTPSTNESRT